jgi:phospholipid/cholesterol/gamma-HCH transport system substrate-binding protein
MDDRIVKFQVGIMVLAALLIFVILVMMFGQMPSFLNNSYTVFIWFPQTPGVAEETPVRKDGIRIGHVSGVKLLDSGGVVVTAQIYGKYKLRRNEVCRLTSSLLGDAVLQFVQGPGGRAEDFIKNGDYFEGTVATNPLQMFDTMQGDFTQAISSISLAGRNVAEASDYLNQFFARNDEQLQRIVGKTESALDSFQQAASDIDSLISDPKMRADLREGLASLPQLLKDTRDAIADIRRAVGLASGNLEALQGLTKPLGERGPHIIENANASIERLNELLTQFVAFSRALNSREGSLGQFISDPEAYQRLTAAARNIEAITCEVRSQLRPIMANINVITDKVARHPGSVLRDAVKPNSGIK